MTTQYTPILQLALPVTGELNGTWGDVVNNNITSMVEEAIAGKASISTWTANSHTLTTADGTTDEARCAMLIASTGAGGTALTGAGQIICPARTKLFVLSNTSAYAVTLKTAAGTGVAVAAGDTAFLFCDGTNVNSCVTQIVNGHITGNLTVDGNTTLGDSSADTVTVNAGVTTLKAQAALRFEDAAGGEYVGLKAPTAVTTYTLTLPIADGAAGDALVTNGAGVLSWSTAASGDVYGPASSTDNALVRFDLTTGKLIQNSVAILSDAGALSGLTGLSSTSITDSGLTSGRVTYATTGGLLTDSANLTFDGTYLTVNSLKDSALTAGRVNYNGAAGLLTDSANLTFDGTTLTAGGFSTAGSVTLSGGTANGVAYLNGSKVLTSGSALTFDGTNFATTGTASATKLIPTGGSATGNGMYLPAANTLAWSTNGAEGMRLDSSGNLGLGVTPSAWGGFTAMQIGSCASFAGQATSSSINFNTYYNGSNYVYLASSKNALQYLQAYDGTHRWYTAPSGTAGNAISFTQAMTLDASGNLGVGTSSISYGGVQIGDGTGAGYKVFRAFGANCDLVMGQVPATRFGLSSGTYAAVYNDANQALALGTIAAYPIVFGTNNTERMRIDSSGNVGIGTSSPAQRLDVQTASGNYQFRLGNTGNTAYTYDIGRNTSDGYLYFYGNQSGSNGFVFSGSDGERMRIDSSGNLLVGCTDPSNTVNGAKINASASGSYIRCSTSYSTSSGTTYEYYSTGASAYRFYVGADGVIRATNTSISAISDQRLKENVRDLDIGLDAVMALKPRKFDWKEGKGKDIKDDRGFIAQEFEQVFPDLIDEWKDPAPEGEEPYKSVRQDLIPVLVKAIQELKAELDATKAEVAALKGA